MARALGRFRSALRVSLRKGEWEIAGGARLGGGAVDPAGGSVDTPPVVAVFGGGGTASAGR
jgi:hypothetical protein